MLLRYLTAGESHGPALTGIIDGLPAGIKLCQADFDNLLKKRWAGYGRSSRKKIEQDIVEVLSGVYNSHTTGAPVSLLIKNNDYKNHSHYMHPFTEIKNDEGKLFVYRPGHADFPGHHKYMTADLRPIRERASARETAMRCALSVPARNLLKELKINSVCLVESIGGISAKTDFSLNYNQQKTLLEQNDDKFMTTDKEIIAEWKNLIDEQSKKHKTVGGTASIIIYNLPCGLGSCMQHYSRIDSIIASAALSIPAVKGVEFGQAAKISQALDQVTDNIYYSDQIGFHHKSNNAAGIEGGMTNGEPLIVRIHVKPVPCAIGTQSVNIKTLDPDTPESYRSDTQAVTGAAIAAESTIILTITNEILKFTGGSTLTTISNRLKKA